MSGLIQTFKDHLFPSWEKGVGLGGGGCSHKRCVRHAGRRVMHFHTGFSENKVRVRHLLVLFEQPVLAVFVRFPYRVVRLVAFIPVVEGVKLGQRRWHLEQWKATEGGLKPTQKLGVIAHARFLFVETVSHTAKEVGKVALYPLVAVGIEFAALWGIFDPYAGRMMIRDLQRVVTPGTAALTKWERNRSVKKIFGHTFSMSKVSYLIKDSFTSFCSEKDWKKRNLYRLLPKYDHLSREGLVLQIGFVEEYYSDFFSDEEKTELRELKRNLKNKECDFSGQDYVVLHHRLLQIPKAKKSILKSRLEGNCLLKDEFINLLKEINSKNKTEKES